MSCSSCCALPILATSLTKYDVTIPPLCCCRAPVQNLLPNTINRNVFMKNQTPRFRRPVCFQKFTACQFVAKLLDTIRNKNLCHVECPSGTSYQLNEKRHDVASRTKRQYPRKHKTVWHLESPQHCPLQCDSSANSRTEMSMRFSTSRDCDGDKPEFRTNLAHQSLQKQSWVRDSRIVRTVPENASGMVGNVEDVRVSARCPGVFQTACTASASPRTFCVRPLPEIEANTTMTMIVSCVVISFLPHGQERSFAFLPQIIPFNPSASTHQFSSWSSGLTGVPNAFFELQQAFLVDTRGFLGHRKKRVLLNQPKTKHPSLLNVRSQTYLLPSFPPSPPPPPQSPQNTQTPKHTHHTHKTHTQHIQTTHTHTKHMC